MTSTNNSAAEADATVFIKLISQDGFEFLIQREAAFQSKILKGFIEANEASAPSYSHRAHWTQARAAATAAKKLTEVRLDLIKGDVLDLICQYLTERLATDAKMSDFMPLQLLDPEKESDRQLVLNLLLAADFLEC